MPTIEDFQDLQLRVGTVLTVEAHVGARRPAYQLLINFGPLGEMQSSAQIADRYQPEELIGRQVVAVTGLPPLNIGGFRSDVLILGALTASGVVLLNTDVAVDPGNEVA
ncbi:MAG: tRNA-binding protein [Acidimicrobiia bacterium]